jgi:twinkle protein
MDITEIKSRLNDRVEDVCRVLLPLGKRAGAEWRVGSVGGEEGRSLGVHLAGAKSGLWMDFATGKDGGDLIDLIAAVKGLGLAESVKWAKDFLGISAPKFSPAVPPKKFKRPDRPKGVQTPQFAVRDYLMGRGLSPATIEAFQVAEIECRRFRRKRGGYYEGATIVFPFKTARDGELCLLKFLAVDRPVIEGEGKPERLQDVSPDAEPILFGWQAFPARSREVVICEGEINAMSLAQYGMPALAPPFGAGKGAKQAWIEREWERLEQFERIVLVFDKDEAGEEAVRDLVDRLGRHRCFVAPPCPDGHKDPNDCLRFGVPLERMVAWITAAEPRDPEELRPAESYTDAVLETFAPATEREQGYSMPISGLERFRTRLGELTLWSGFTGHGKTEVLNWVHMSSLLRRGERSCIGSYEMPAPRLLHRCTRQLSGTETPSPDHIRACMSWLAGKLWIHEREDRRANLESILSTFLYAYRRYGVRYFVIDSLMRCGIKEDDYPAQSEFAYRLATFCMQYQVHIDLVAHGKKQDSDKVETDTQGVKGAGGLADQAHNVVIVARNTRKEMRNESGGPDGWIRVVKQREGNGWLGSVEIYFDPKSKQYSGEEWFTPTPIVLPTGDAQNEEERDVSEHEF